MSARSRYLSLLMIAVILTGCHYTKKFELVPVWRPKFRGIATFEDNFDKAFQALEENDLSAAETYFLNILEFEPENEIVLNNLGRIYFDQRKYYLAATSFQKALNVSSGPEVQHNNLGQVWESAKQYENAEREYRQAIEINPGCYEYRSHLARVLRRQKRTDLETESLLQDVARLDDRESWRDWANLQLIKLREENERVANQQQQSNGNQIPFQNDTSGQINVLDTAPQEIVGESLIPLTPKELPPLKKQEEKAIDEEPASSKDRSTGSLHPLLPVPSKKQGAK